MWVQVVPRRPLRRGSACKGITAGGGHVVPRAAVRRGRMCHQCFRGIWRLPPCFCGHLELCPIKELWLWLFISLWTSDSTLALWSLWRGYFFFLHKFGITCFKHGTSGDVSNCYVLAQLSMMAACWNQVWQYQYVIIGLKKVWVLPCVLVRSCLKVMST